MLVRQLSTAVLFATLWPAIPAAGRPHWAGQMLEAHNRVRQRHKLKPLVWSNQLADVAQRWAGHLADTDQFQHSTDTPYGENLFAITVARASAGRVVKAWADEEHNYDYKENRCKKGMCGHYTQIVWRDTREVGCGVARRGEREVWVCEYSPPGNYVGRRPY